MYESSKTGDDEKVSTMMLTCINLAIPEINIKILIFYLTIKNLHIFYGTIFSKS